MLEPDGFPGLSVNAKEREARASDFGGIIRRMPAAVATPESAAEVASVVRRAGRDGVPVAVRGAGHSQSGGSLTEGGLVLDATGLKRVEPLGKELIRAQGGALWDDVVDALEGTGRLPRVLVDIAEATVGGTLAAGGFGTTSHRHGVQAGQVEQLEVVTGTGERLRCSRTDNADLFDAVRGGQGQFGVITEAWIRLRRAGKRIRLHELLYRDFGRFESDFRRLVAEDRFHHVRAQTRVREREIILTVGSEYDGEQYDGKALDGLGHDKIIWARDTDEVGRAGMYPKWGFSRTNYHPWRDWFLPWETLPKLIAQPWLDPEWVPPSPWNWIGMYPIRMKRDDAPLFMRPDVERMTSYSVLCVARTYEEATGLVERLREVDRALVELGGKSYLSGRVGYGRAEWKEHYGENFERGRQWKREFDPKRVFRGNDLPFADNPDSSLRSLG